jgi:hypothetical protein
MQFVEIVYSVSHVWDFEHVCLGVWGGEGGGRPGNAVREERSNADMGASVLCKL